MKKYLSVLAASVFILSAAGCSAQNVNGAYSDLASSADAMYGSDEVTGGADGGAGSPAADHGTPTTGDSVSAATAGSTTGATSAASVRGDGTGEIASTKADSAVTGVPEVKNTAEEAAADSGSETAAAKKETSEPKEYAPVDIGGIGDDAAADELVSVDGALSGFVDIAEDFVYGDMDVIDGGYDDVIICPADPWDDYEYIQPSAGLLTGGEWRDNDHWSDWKALYSSHSDWSGYRDVWRVNYENRAAVSVTSGGSPVEGARVSCSNGTSAVTDNKGRAYIFYAADSGDITVEYNGETKTAESVSGDGSAEVVLDGEAKQLNKLDLMIMCDTTGSMADELSYLQVELSDIVTKIQNANANTDLMLSVNFYRDEGDEYVVREYPFTDDINAAVSAIGQQRADGGGDYPEAVHTALDSAVNSHDWDEDAVKIMFLVLDAPPHSEDVQVVDSVRRYVEQAAEKGIRIIPIASSGVDKSTEYLLRTMSFVTGGTYTFLTDDSGVGGGHIEPTVGAYNVEKLNDMMIRIVNGYLD